MDGYGATMRRYKENLPDAAAGMKTRMIPTLKRAVLISLLIGLAAGIKNRPRPRLLNSPSAVESFARRASAITDSGLNTGRGQVYLFAVDEGRKGDHTGSPLQNLEKSRNPV
ncbi:MAG: hypothetical protein CEE38_19065 [Planctomycetes bacterium B3_Pla]|nr:MAG: hypothetical protein CEE38_19065 [Planctomycetes bacterium B3_Pla]